MAMAKYFIYICFTTKANENKEMWKAKQQEAEEALALTQMLDTIQLYSYYFMLLFSQQTELKDGYSKMEKELLRYTIESTIS